MAEDAPDAPPEGEQAELSGPSLDKLEEAFDDLVAAGSCDDEKRKSNDGDADANVDADADAEDEESDTSQLLQSGGLAESVSRLVEGGRIQIDDDGDIFSAVIGPASRRGSEADTDANNSTSAVEGATERTGENVKEEATKDTAHKGISEAQKDEAVVNEEDSSTKQPTSGMTDTLEPATSSTSSAEGNKDEAVANEEGSSTKQPSSEMIDTLEPASSAKGDKDDDKNEDDVVDDNEEDEDVRKAKAMVELMRTHPHLAPEELSRRASELVGDSRQMKLVEAKMPPKPKSILEGALNTKQGQGLMAALKETGILQSVPSMDSESSSGDGASSHNQIPAAAAGHNVNVLSGFKNVQESFRHQQSKVTKNVTKNLKDFGLIKEQGGQTTDPATPGTDAAGGTTPRTRVASATSPSSLNQVGSTDFGGGSPDTKNRTTVVAVTDGSRTVTPKTSYGGEVQESDMASVSAPAAAGRGGTYSSADGNSDVPAMPDLDVSKIGKDTKVAAIPTSPSKVSSPQLQSPSRAAAAASALSQSFQTPGVPAMPKLFATKGEIQGFPLNAAGAALSSMVWKRRSGLGKLQKNAWEKRRMVLRGRVICYFKDDSEVRPATPPRQASVEDVIVGNDTMSSPSIGVDDDSSSKRQTWWEQATSNIQKQAAEITQQVATSIAEGQLPGSQPVDPNAPRGVIDIVKERATFAATAGHSGAPSPFCISMKVKGETKWKIAFETRSEQMKWLAALTDVVVQRFTDEYNEGLKMAESTSSLGEKRGGGEAVPNELTLVQQPSLANLNVGGFLPAPTAATLYFPPPNNAEKFWHLDEYAIRGSSGDDETFDDESEGSFDDDSGEEESRNKSERGDLTDAVFGLISKHMPILKPSTRLGEKWMLRGDPLYYSIALLNLAVIYARRSSTSIAQFWFFTFAANVIVWVCVKNVDDDALLSKIGDAAMKEEKTKKKRKKKEAKKAAPLKIIRPRAGSTSMWVEKAKDKPTNKEGHQFCGYRSLPSNEFQVRSHGYLSTKKKIPCSGELYTLVAMDVFESSKQYRDMGKRVKLPLVTFKDKGEKTWHSPDIFVVSVALPTEAPKLGRPEDDGQGFTITMYFTMKQSTRNILRKVTASGYGATQDKSEADKDVQKRLVNGVRLWEEWCRRAPEDPSFQARFKFIPFGSNLAEIGVPGWIGKYNGKPVLIKRAGITGFLFDHPELNAMGFDISLHPFPYLAKQATAYMAETYFKQMIASFAFVIEGRSDDELPEVLIGQGAQICYPDPARAIKADDWFTGQSPISDETSEPTLVQDKEKDAEEVNEEPRRPGQESAPSPSADDEAQVEDTVTI